MTESNRNGDQFLKLVEHASQAIFVVQDRQLVYLNPATTRVTGYSSDELMAKPFADFLHPEDQKRVVDRHVRRLKGETLPEAYSFRVLHKEGRMVWVELNAVLTEWNGRPATLNYLRDISNRKTAEAELRRNEARLRSLVRILQYPSEHIQEFLDYALNEAIALTDSKIGYIYFYNEARGEFILNTWSRDVMKECAVAEPQTLYQLDKTGIWGEAVRQRTPILINDFQAPHPLKKGYPEGHVALYRFLTVPVIRDDRIVAVVGVGNKETPYTETDTLQLTLLMDAVWRETDRRETEISLQEREKTYRSLFDSIRDPILVADPARNIVDCNPAFTELFGYTLENIRGLKTEIIYENETQYRKTGQELRDNPGTQEIVATLDFKKKSGDTFPGEVKLSCLKDKDDRITGVIGQIRDLSERKQAEAERAELEAQFRQAQKLEAVGLLTGGVAHDFNNLLGVIAGYTGLMLMDLAETSPLRHKVLQIQDAGERAASLVRQLMAFSRKQVIEPEVLNFNQVLSGLKKMLPRIIGEDIELVFSPAPDLGNVMADPGQMEQVVMNLIVNARDAMSQGGNLTIETANVMLDEAYAHRHAGVAAGPHAMMAVSDTGAGMDKAVLEKIFDPFFTTKEPGKGTGLGLSTVYGIVKQHGGHIWVYGEPGHGTTFKIYLPRVDQTLQKEDPVQDHGPHEGTETLLLVEDHEHVREMIQTMLEAIGYRVIAAETAEKGLAFAREEQGPLHLLFTDIVLPGMSGRELVRQLNAIRPETKVLCMSGYSDDAIVRHGELEEGVAFIQKPFTLGELGAKVRKVLDASITP